MCRRLLLPLPVLSFLVLPDAEIRSEVRQVGPLFGLHSGVETTHPFLSFPEVTGTVTVEIQCKADLGCHPWDFTDCNTGSGLCDVDPTNKWVRVTIAGETIEGTDPFVGVPNVGDPPVPADGHFFSCYNNNATTTPQCGFSLCTGAQFPNLHRFTITEFQWNTWLGGGSSVTVVVTSQSVMKNLPTYCTQDASGGLCCPTGVGGECGGRPGSNATVIITFTPAPTGSCCIADTGECFERTQSQCTALGGSWTQGQSCTPNPCPQPPFGACCLNSGACMSLAQALCGSIGGTFSGDGTSCEPNPCAQPQISYVDEQAGGAGDGSKWNDAHTDLQSAIAAAGVGGFQIWVAEGTYLPSAPAGRAATFQLPDGVAIYGGFAGGDSTEFPGGETDVSQREPVLHPTILSGDIGTPGVSSDNSYHVVTASGADVAVLLDGFVITAGRADGQMFDGIGGGLLKLGGQPTIRNCQFVGNTAVGAGGAIYNSADDLRLINCAFSGNSATGGGAQAGALRNLNCDTTLTNCTFSANHAADIGGGIHHQGGTSTLNNCILWGNTQGGVGAPADAQLTVGAGTAVVTYSDIQGGWTGTGNINVNPGFVDADGADNTTGTLDDDLRLLSGSPCIDASDNDADVDTVPPGLQPLPVVDGDIRARRMDDENTADSGNGACPVADMGAFEFRRLCELGACPRGDGNADGLVDGRDIQPLVSCLLGATPACACPCFDMDLDGQVTQVDDVACFVAVLLGDSTCIVSCSSGGFRSAPDCNDNSIDDLSDIFVDTSADCNANGIPDACEIDENSTVPGGPFFCQQDCAQDLNGNGILDECEPDCNANGRPDDFDIAQQTSNDVNTNGIPDDCEPDCNTNGTPDDWDIAQTTSADCNSNGKPDECEQDCNANGVPDDCDIDPTDPDGDLLVSADCNSNGWPDECDLTLPPGFGSLDCNTNGTPDECDIAGCAGDPACADCNFNGIPDACDIGAAISEDANGNGIPDECESQQAQGGGSGGSEESTGGTPMPQESTGGGDESIGGGDESTGGTPMLPDDDAAWDAFWDWSCDITQGADPSLSGDQKFAAMVAKMQELGLPVMNPWMAAVGP